MANPKPVYTLTQWKVLSNEEASELIDKGQMQREIPNVPTEHFTNAELETLSKGQPLFCVWKGQYIMVSYRNGRFVGYEVEERKPEPPKSVADKVRTFFRGMFGVFAVLMMLTSCEKLERTLTADLTALGLNYNSTVSKMKEDAASGVDTEKDGLTKLLVEARDSMNEVPEMDD